LPSVQTLEADPQDEWDTYLRSHGGGLVYQSLAWRDLLVDLLGCRAEYLVVRSRGRITGALPMMWRQTSGRTILNSLPYFGSNGGIVASDAISHDHLVSAWNERACDPGTASATMICNPFIAASEEGICHTHVDSRWSHATMLEQDRDPLELTEPSAARNVRKAQRSGLEVHRDPGALGELAVLHGEHMGGLGGRVKDKRFFSILSRRLQAGRNYDVYVARTDGELAAGLLVLYFDRTVEYFLPAIAQRFRSLQPLALLLYRAMLDAASRGFSRWNWGGSWPSQEGIVRFKRKWGGMPRSYAYYTQLNDASLQHEGAERLLALGGHFFVVPFSSLTPAGANHS